MHVQMLCSSDWTNWDNVDCPGIPGGVPGGILGALTGGYPGGVPGGVSTRLPGNWFLIIY